jgi:spermidine synthase
MYEHTSAHHRVQVVDANGFRHLKFERNQQSSMGLDDPYDTDIEYIAYLHIALAIQPAIDRALIIGLGGGSLAKQLWRDHSDMRIDAIELDPEIVDVAYELFGLPDDDRIRVIIGEGRECLETTNELYDLIVIDAYDDDHIPPHLLTEQFLLACRDHLAPDGVIAYNLIASVHGDHSKPFRSFYRTVSNVWRNIWLFPVGLALSGPIQLAFGGNIVLLASDIELSTHDLLSRIAQHVDGRVRVKGFGQLGKDLYQGAIRSGDVPILTDPPQPRRRRNANPG